MLTREVLIAFAAISSVIDAELLPIKTYTTADGLAADRINAIVTDSRGFLWFCTQEGLSRFDGHRFVSYSVADGLPNPVVFTLTEARNGDHWIGTARGLGRIAAKRHLAQLTSYKLGPQRAANYVVAVVESRSGKMLAATAGGIFEWSDPLGVESARLQVPLSQLPFRRGELRISDMVEDPNGNLWVGTTTGLHLVRHGALYASFTTENGLPGDWVEMLMLDSKGNMWAALRGGLVQFEEKAGGAWGIHSIFTTELASVGVAALKEASDGTLWVATSQGISRLRWPRGRQSPPVIENFGRAQGLSDRSILSLAEDPAGNIWAGTESAGVMRIGRLGFTTFREKDGLGSDRVMSLIEGRAGELLAVTIPEGNKPARSVDLFDGLRFHSVVPQTFSDHPTWGWNQTLLQSRASGEWWAATSQGLCRYGVMKAADLDGRKPQVCYASDTTVFRIFEDSKGGIWASAQSKLGDRLMRWSPEANAVREYTGPKTPAEGERFRNDLVGAFAGDAEGNVWMGLYAGGLYRYNKNGFQYFQRTDGMPGGSILALLVNANGLWIGADGGGLGWIRSPSGDHPKVEIYNTARGMTSDVIQVLVDDRAGHVYAGTAKGVDRLDPGTGHIRHFSTADGLAQGAFQGALRDRSGSLWFGTTQGISRLIPTADPPAIQPRILITELHVGGDSYPISPLGETRAGPLELTWSHNQLQAEFAGIDYEPGDAVRYSYKLGGSADTSWSVPLNQRNVNYAALAAGSYRFLVKAITSEGVESGAPAEIEFTVLPVFWKRWWFLALVMASILAMVFAAHRYRVVQMVGLERMRTAIATDLHDDIGASLSQIAILSEVARVGGNGHGPGEALERVAALARELVDSMGDIVWSIRTEPRGMDSLIRRMREFALDVLASQGIEFELRAPQTGDSLPLSLEARRQLFLMFKECIHNAARHSRATTVVADLEVVEHEVVLVVEDDGSGAANGQKAPGYGSGGTGIQGMTKRAEGLGGRFAMTSTPGQGCRVEIRLPARRGALGRPVS